MKKVIDLSVIIVSYNTKALTIQALSSLQQHLQHVSHEVIVVDNGSSDGSIESCKREFPQARYISLPENRGFSVANNIGITDCQGRYVMLLNSDAQLTANSRLDTIIKYLDKNQRVGAITPQVRLSSGALDPASHRGEPTLWAALTYYLGFEHAFPTSPLFGQYHQSWKDMTKIHQIDACSGAAMIVNKKVIDQVGLLDERFFMYAEDLDWCRRIREAGYLIEYFPESTVVHHKYKSGLDKQTPSNVRNQTNRYFFQTMKQYYQKYHPQASKLHLHGVFLLIDALRFLKCR